MEGIPHPEHDAIKGGGDLGSQLVSWWATTLCFAILKPLRNSLLRRKSKCGQVYMLFIWHNVELGLVCVCVCGAKIYLFYDCPCIGRIGT